MKSEKEIRTVQIPMSEATYQKLIKLRGRRTWLELINEEVLEKVKA